MMSEIKYGKITVAMFRCRECKDMVGPDDLGLRIELLADNDVFLRNEYLCKSCHKRFVGEQGYYIDAIQEANDE